MTVIVNGLYSSQAIAWAKSLGVSNARTVFLTDDDQIMVLADADWLVAVHFLHKKYNSSACGK